MSSGLWGSMYTALGFGSPASRGGSYLGEILHWHLRESTCNAGVPGSIPGLGRSTGEGIGYPLQNSWASLVAQLVKSPPAMRETWVRSLGWEDPLEKGKATHSSILAWRILGVTKSRTRLSDFHFFHFFFFSIGWVYRSQKEPYDPSLAARRWGNEQCSCLGTSLLGE